ALEIAKIIHADPKNANLPIVALGDGSQRALMEAFQAGCDDYIDRNRQPARSEEHTSELQSRFDLVCRLLLEKKKKKDHTKPLKIIKKYLITNIYSNNYYITDV